MKSRTTLLCGALAAAFSTTASHGVTTTSAFVGTFEDSIARSGGGAPVSINASELDAPNDFGGTNPTGRIQVSQGSVRFEFDNSADGLNVHPSYNRTHFQGTYLDTLSFHLPMVEGYSAEQSAIFVTINFQIDGLIHDDPLLDPDQVGLATTAAYGRFETFIASSLMGLPQILEGQPVFDFQLVPNGQTSYGLSTGEIFEAGAAGYVNTGTRSVTYRLQSQKYSQWDGDRQEFYNWFPESDYSLFLGGNVQGHLLGDASMDFWNSMTMDLLLPIGTTFTTESGFSPMVTYYDPNASAVPDAANPALLLACTSALLMISRSASRQRG